MGWGTSDGDIFEQLSDFFVCRMDVLCGISYLVRHFLNQNISMLECIDSI